MTPNIKAPAANGGRWKAVGTNHTPPGKPWRCTEATPYLRSDPLYDAAAALAEKRARAELDLVGMLCADPGRGADVLRSVGVTPELIDPQDLRLIAQAADTARERLTAAKVARLLLRYYGHWDPSDCRPFVCGSLWSDHSLAALFHSFPFVADVARCFATRLVEIDHRQRAAMELYRDALAMLTGEVPHA